MLPIRQDDRGASAAANELPRVALKIDGGGTLAGRAWTSGAIVLTLQSDAKTFLLVGSDGSLLFRLGERGRAGKARQGARQRACENDRADYILCRHWISLLTVRRCPSSASRDSIVRGESDGCSLRASDHARIFARRVFKVKCLFAIDAIAGVYRCVTSLENDLGAPCRNWLSGPPTVAC
jgi:hypothetical protein